MGAAKKKKSKRSGSAADDHPSATADVADMPSRPLRRRASSLPSALVVFSALLLIYITWRFIISTPSNNIINEEKLPISSDSRFYSYEIVNEFPHDPAAFTQGLVYGGNNTLFESTGLHHRSSVRQVDLQSGKVKLIHQMDGSLFGEGLTLIRDRLFQVVWLKRTGFIYDRYSLTEQERFTHSMRDGWGLATDGKVVFGSDGSSALYQLDSQTLKEFKRVVVKYKDHEVPYINELEYVNGEIWANIWQTDCIARISYSDGKVLGWILLHGLRQSLVESGHNGIDVLNGIAWDEENNRLFVTGKLWPKLYEIKLHPVPGPPNGRIGGLCSVPAWL